MIILARSPSARFIADDEVRKGRACIWLPGAALRAVPGCQVTGKRRRLHLPQLQRLELQGEIARENPALREAAGGEPQSGLRRAPPHVAELAALVEPPDRPDALGNIVTEVEPRGFLLVLVAGRKHEQFSGHDAPVAQPHTGRDEAVNIGKLQQRSEEHTSELQSLRHLVCRLLLEKKKTQNK